MATLNQIMDYIADHVDKKKQLWTNNSPTVAFSAQTVQVNLSSYKGVEIVWRWSTADDGIFKQAFDKDTSSMIFAMANNRVYRELSVSDSGVTFTTGYLGAYNQQATATTYYAIPIAIYGIN